MRRRWYFIIPLVLVGIVVFATIGGQIVLHLWNWLLPGLFGFRTITFWQALGLLVLARILFGGFGCHGRSHSNARRRMQERWEHMTPEERERFRQGMGRFCGFRDAAPTESKGQ